MSVPGLKEVINTPMHQVWELPDGIHLVDVFKYTTFAYCCVRDNNYRTRESVTVKYATPNHEQLIELFKELSVKRYPRNIMKRGAEVEKFFRRY